MRSTSATTHFISFAVYLEAVLIPVVRVTKAVGNKELSSELPIRINSVCLGKHRMKLPGAIPISEYLAGEELSGVKHEYLGGTVHAMAGATNQHNAIAVNALVFLVAALRGKPCRPFNSDTKVRIEYPDHTRFYYPDALVVCHQNPPSDHFQDHPVVVVEVLSDGTRRTDLGEKRDAYLTISTLKVLILAESNSAEALVHRRKPEGGFAVEVYAGLEAVIPLPEIDSSLSLAELYEQVDLSMP
jgi:Uma2 family endonuclease